jgi:hypothetical protein
MSADQTRAILSQAVDDPCPYVKEFTRQALETPKINGKKTNAESTNPQDYN